MIQIDKDGFTIINKYLDYENYINPDIKEIDKTYLEFSNNLDRSELVRKFIIIILSWSHHIQFPKAINLITTIDNNGNIGKIVHYEFDNKTKKDFIKEQTVEEFCLEYKVPIRTFLKGEKERHDDDVVNTLVDYFKFLKDNHKKKQGLEYYF